MEVFRDVQVVGKLPSVLHFLKGIESLLVVDLKSFPPGLLSDFAVYHSCHLAAHRCYLHVAHLRMRREGGEGERERLREEGERE